MDCTTPDKQQWLHAFSCVKCQDSQMGQLKVRNPFMCTTTVVQERPRRHFVLTKYMRRTRLAIVMFVFPCI